MLDLQAQIKTAFEMCHKSVIGALKLFTFGKGTVVKVLHFIASTNIAFYKKKKKKDMNNAKVWQPQQCRIIKDYIKNNIL